MSLFLLGCVSKEFIEVPKLIGCPQFKPIKLPNSFDWSLEPLGMTDVLDKNVSHAIVYRDLSKTNLGDHSYKNASIMDNDLIITIYDYIGYLITEIDAYNKEAEKENNSTKKDNKNNVL